MATVVQMAGKNHEPIELTSYTAFRDVVTVESGMASRIWAPPVIESDGAEGLFIHPDRMAIGGLYPFYILNTPLLAVKNEDGTVNFFGLPD